jgi:RHS repeat-associated protein
MEKEEESGLSYHRARYYAPWLGRWITPDPAGLVDEFNTYTYSRNSPVVLIDPNGMQPPDPRGYSSEDEFLAAAPSPYSRDYLMGLWTQSRQTPPESEIQFEDDEWNARGTLTLDPETANRINTLTENGLPQWVDPDTGESFPTTRLFAGNPVPIFVLRYEPFLTPKVPEIPFLFGGERPARTFSSWLIEPAGEFSGAEIRFLGNVQITDAWETFKLGVDVASFLAPGIGKAAEGTAASWIRRGAENDVRFMALDLRGKLLYELGAGRVPNATYERLGLDSIPEAERKGERLLEDASGNWLKAFLNPGAKDLDKTAMPFMKWLSTGPTPAFRWLAPKIVVPATSRLIVHDVEGLRKVQ